MLRRAVLVGFTLMAAASCRGQASAPAAPPASSRSEPTRPAKPAPGMSGFVVYAIDDAGEASTWLAPYRLGDALTTEPARRLDGWWLQDVAAERVTAWHRGTDEDPWKLPEAIAARLWDARCAPGDSSETSCTWPPRQVMTGFAADGRAHEQLVDERACSCFELPVADRAVLLAGEFDDEAYLDGDDTGEEEECEYAFHDSDSEVVALLGGVLQSFTWYSSLQCDGTRANEVMLAEKSLIADAAPPKSGRDDADWFCRLGDPDELDWELPASFEDEAEAEESGETESGGWSDEDARDCDIDGELVAVRRGRLVRSEIGANLLRSCVCHVWAPVSPNQCPSLADACGRTTAFPELADEVDEFWIASDERAALVLGGTSTILAAAGRLRAPIPAPEPELSGRILGVRHHARIEPLMRASAAADGEEPALPWLSIALRWPTTSVPPPPPLAPADRKRLERRGGRDWGNRCFAHFKAKRYEAAEAACAQGLAVATDAAIRGAIFHSLGRISEARGDDPAARVYYRTSLALRPDEATEKRFARLLRESR